MSEHSPDSTPKGTGREADHDHRHGHHKPRKNPFKWATVQILITGMILLIVGTGVSLVYMQYRHRLMNHHAYAERMDPKTNEPGLTAAEYSLPDSAKPAVVVTGIYVDRIVELSMKDLNWQVDCYLWFRWKDSTVDIDEHFQVVDGWVESKEKKLEIVKDGVHYVQYRIVARITNVFDEFRFPCDDHLLTVCIEDPDHQRGQVLLAADSLNSAVSSRVRIPGYQIDRMAVVEKPHAYKTGRGDPRFEDGRKATYSQLRLGLWIRRDGWGFFLKMFLPLYISVCVAMLAFFINPLHSDPRFGLGVGALFAAVANSYINSSMLPNTGVLSLTDVINLVGTSTILLTLVESAISLYIYEKRGKHELSRRYDRISFYIMLMGYIALNITIPIAASG